MRNYAKITVLTCSLLALVAGSAFATTQKTYQVTGPVVEMNDTTIVISKGKERWEIAKDAATKINGDLKVGSRVTIQYTMAAATVDVKTDKTTKADATKRQ